MATITEQDSTAVRICFSNRVHEPHDNCKGLDEETYFERMMDAAS